MNGGPGASSLAGLFGENGPLLLKADMSLIQNPYAWNKKANVLHIEFGPGIGYSYCHNSTLADGPCSGARREHGECSPCYASDSSVATQNAIVLETLLSDPSLFPELAGRPLYILGESYAGVCEFSFSFSFSFFLFLIFFKTL
jgi:serine carboxypeptidase-like clade 2